MWVLIDRYAVEHSEDGARRLLDQVKEATRRGIILDVDLDDGQRLIIGPGASIATVRDLPDGVTVLAPV